MAGSDAIAAYRLHAATCIEIAQRSADETIKLLLLDMAQSWLVLAEQAVKNTDAVVIVETAIPKQA